jgi:hypothetical protein
MRILRLLRCISKLPQLIIKHHAPPCYGSHAKPLVPAAFVVSTHQSAGARVEGYGSFSLCVTHKEASPSSGGNNGLMMAYTYERQFIC